MRIYELRNQRKGFLLGNLPFGQELDIVGYALIVGHVSPHFKEFLAHTLSSGFNADAPMLRILFFGSFVEKVLHQNTIVAQAWMLL